MKIKEGVFRKDFHRMFEMTDTLTCRKLKHAPFIVLDEVEGITLCDNAEDLVAKFPPETKVLKQWRGEWSSDILVMEVADVALALKNKTQYD